MHALLGPILFVLCLGAAQGSGADSAPQASEYEIKAAFLLNFVRYTNWPAASFDGPKSPIRLTVVGRDPFGATLETTFKGEEVHGHPVVVARADEVREDLRAHIVFAGDLPEADRHRLIQACAGRPTLLVGEVPHFAEDGACINFYLSDHKVRFEVNTDASAAASLEISPAMLKLAKIVHSRKKP